MPLDKAEIEMRERLERRRMLNRIEANTIVARTTFRDHFCNHPGRHSWDLCGHPLYYWAFKAVLGSKYIQKFFVYTEVEEALEMGAEMSDKFVPIKRSLDLCKEDVPTILDDLKTPESKRYRFPEYGKDLIRNKEIEVLGNVEPVRVLCPIPSCLVISESIDRLIEAYFSDPFAEQATLIYKCCSSHFMIDPAIGYLLNVAFNRIGSRQRCFQMYHETGFWIPHWQEASQRVIGVEVPAEEGVDIGDEETLRLARIFMRDRLEKEKDTKQFP